MRWAGVLLTLATMLGVATPTRAASADPVRTYTVVQRLRLDPGQDGSFSLACRTGDVATDGTWRAGALGLDVLEADSISAGTYRFQVSNDATTTAALRLTVVCVHGPRLRLVGGRGTVAAAVAAAGTASAPALRCPAGSAAIAPGFRIDGGIARVTTRFPHGLTSTLLSLVAIDPVTVTSSTRCLRPGARLRLAFRAGQTDVQAGRVESFSVSCRHGEAAIVGSYRLHGAWYLGQTPAGARRSFRLQASSTTSGGDARLGVLCLSERAR
jgi:hypothetical protein